VLGSEGFLDQVQEQMQGDPREQTGMRALGKMAGGIDYVSVSVAVRRLQQRLKKDRELARLYQKARARMNNEKI